MEAWAATKKSGQPTSNNDHYDAAVGWLSNPNDHDDDSSSLGLALEADDDDEKAPPMPGTTRGQRVRGMFQQWSSNVSRILQKRRQNQQVSQEETQQVQRFQRRSLVFWEQQKKQAQQGTEQETIASDKWDSMLRSRGHDDDDHDKDSSLPMIEVEVPPSHLGESIRSFVSHGEESYLLDLQHQKEKREEVRMEETLEDALELYEVALKERGLEENEKLFHVIFHKLLKDRAPRALEEDKIQDERIEQELERKKSAGLDELLAMSETTKRQA